MAPTIVCGTSAHDAPWDETELNERRLEVMQQCRQTRLQQGFTLIIDDSGHRKTGSATAGVGRQYIGEIGKTDNGVVLLTTYLYDGVRKLPLDIALYQHASSLAQGKADPKLMKKPDLALQLIDKCLERGYRPKVTVFTYFCSGFGGFPYRITIIALYAGLIRIPMYSPLTKRSLAMFGLRKF